MPDRQISDGREGKESRSQEEKCVSISFSEYVSVRQKQPTSSTASFQTQKVYILEMEERFSNSSFCDGSESKLFRPEPHVGVLWFICLHRNALTLPGCLELCSVLSSPLLLGLKAKMIMMLLTLLGFTQTISEVSIHHVYCQCECTRFLITYNDTIMSNHSISLEICAMVYSWFRIECILY